MTRPFDLSRATPWPEDLPFHAADLYSNSRPGRCSARGILWISSPLNIYAILLLLFVSRCEIFCKGCWRNSFNCTGEGSLIPRLRGLFSSPDYFFQSNGDGKEYRYVSGEYIPLLKFTSFYSVVKPVLNTGRYTRNIITSLYTPLPTTGGKFRSRLVRLYFTRRLWTGRISR